MGFNSAFKGLTFGNFDIVFISSKKNMPSHSLMMKNGKVSEAFDFCYELSLYSYVIHKNVFTSV